MVDSVKPQIFGAHRCVRSRRSLTSCYSMMQIGWSCAVIRGFLTEFLPLDALVLIHACWLLPILNSSVIFKSVFFFVCLFAFFFLSPLLCFILCLSGHAVTGRRKHRVWGKVLPYSPAFCFYLEFLFVFFLLFSCSGPLT